MDNRMIIPVYKGWGNPSGEDPKGSGAGDIADTAAVADSEDLGYGGGGEDGDQATSSARAQERSKQDVEMDTWQFYLEPSTPSMFLYPRRLVGLQKGEEAEEEDLDLDRRRSLLGLRMRDKKGKRAESGLTSDTTAGASSSAAAQAAGLRRPAGTFGSEGLGLGLGDGGAKKREKPLWVGHREEKLFHAMDMMKRMREKEQRTRKWRTRIDRLWDLANIHIADFSRSGPLYYTALREAEKRGEKDKALRILDDLFLFSRDWDYRERKRLLCDLIKDLTEKTLSMLVRIEYAEVLLKEAVSARQDGNHKLAVALLPDATQPLLEARALAVELPRPLKVEMCDSLLESVEIETGIARAMQTLALGDILLEDILFNREHLCVDALWEVVDWYHQAILLSHGLDVETEAAALSRLGRVYRSVLKMPHRGRVYFHQAVLLAASLQPRNLAGVPWFDEATTALREMQAEAARSDEEEIARRRAPYLEALQAELAALEQAYARETTPAFLAFLYTAHPPRDTSMVRDETQTERKQVFKAMHHYHPDRNSEDKYKDPSWAVLCEEITKLLAKTVNRMKGM